MSKVDYEKLMQEKWDKAIFSLQKAEESLGEALKLAAKIEKGLQQLSSSSDPDNLSSCS